MRLKLFENESLDDELFEKDLNEIYNYSEELRRLEEASYLDDPITWR